MVSAATNKDKAEAFAYARDNDDYHDSDGVDVPEVYLAGLLAERARGDERVKAERERIEQVIEDDPRLSVVDKIDLTRAIRKETP